ncbi:farnesol dehydrogenase-like [Calliopsis andreniformis]|uniref:farnesol dehydrogenase-like n=1 Tax=Calliopsis andreniformis TaxID=337506 RepID=UPI003FCC8494
MAESETVLTIKLWRDHVGGTVRRTIPRTMERWAGKVAIVTGASTGIGAATSKALVNHAVKVVGLARRKDKLEELVAVLGKNHFYPFECDVKKEENILKAFKWIESELGGADILINNAGVSTRSPIIETPTEKYRDVIDVNLIAPAIFAREFTQSIKKRNAKGHIININSVAGHFAEAIHKPFGMYTASKYGLRALTTEIRHEIILAKLNIKVSSISPGPVLTDMLMNLVEVSKEVLEKLPMLRDQNIADAVITTLKTPENVEIQEIVIMPQKMAIGL